MAFPSQTAILDTAPIDWSELTTFVKDSSCAWLAQWQFGVDFCPVHLAEGFPGHRLMIEISKDINNVLNLVQCRGLVQMHLDSEMEELVKLGDKMFWVLTVTGSTKTAMEKSGDRHG